MSKLLKDYLDKFERKINDKKTVSDLTETYSLNESQKQEIEDALKRTIDEQVQARLHSILETSLDILDEVDTSDEVTSHGSDKIPKEIRIDIISQLDELIHNNPELRDYDLFDVIIDWMEAYLRNSDISRSPFVELVNSHLEELGLDGNETPSVGTGVVRSDKNNIYNSTSLPLENQLKEAFHKRALELLE